MTSFPQTAPVEKLNRQHPEYSTYNEAWQQIGTLYKGGIAMREAVLRGGQFLMKNVKELPEVFATRQLWFSYTNLLGNVIGWYLSALFKEPPQYVVKGRAKDGTATGNAPKNGSDFATAFEANCDRSGTSLTDFCRKVVEALLLWRSVYVLHDTPGPDADNDAPVTLQQQQAQGLFDPFLVIYTPADVINWENDAYGNLEWIQIKIRVQSQEFLEAPTITDYWYFFDREQVALYERDNKQDDASAGVPGNSEEVATLSAGYPRRHSMAAQRRVPIRKISLPEGLWLANRVFLPLCNHLNQDNALDFGLMQANLPQLTITDGADGIYEENPTISAVGWHHLPYGATMQFLEPAGNSYAAAQTRIDALEERIYKACYLQAQARGNRSTPTAQSGISKQADMAPSRDALSGIGDAIRPALQHVYQDALTIAQHPDVMADVRGFDFADKASIDDMQLIEAGAAIPVNSQRYEREIGKRVVRVQLPDLNPEALVEIDAEIDANPTPSMLEQQQKEAQAAAQSQQFAASMKAGGNVAA